MIRQFSYAFAALVGLGAVAAQAQAIDVIEQAGRYTVKIITAVEYPFGVERKGTRTGSGFLIDRQRGWILTNAHVAKK